MPTFCVPSARSAKRTSWKFAPGRSARANSTKRCSLLSYVSALYFILQAAWRPHIVLLLPLLAWRNRQTRTAQDRMGKPVEVRVLSRALRALSHLQSGGHTNG